MRYEVRPCVGEKVKYYIVRHKWLYDHPMRWYSWQGSEHYTFQQGVGGTAYFDTAKEAEQKAIELFGTTARIDVKTVQL